MGASISSAGLSHEQFLSADEVGSGMKGGANSTGRMLDSDGFEIAIMDADDYKNLTLEEKILCGYYTAKPSMREAYPIAQMNVAKPY